MSKVTLHSLMTLTQPSVAAYPSSRFGANDKASMLGLYAFWYGDPDVVRSRGLVSVRDSSVTLLAVRDAQA